MEQNSNRDKLLNQLGISGSDKWVGDKIWSPDLNQRIIAWMPEYFIPERRYRYFAMCRNQIGKLWTVFMEWMRENNYDLNLKKIDLGLIRAFEEALPSLGWSRSAIHLIEITLVRVRQYLHAQRIVWCNSHVARASFSGDPELLISVRDFRLIRDAVFDFGSDFEILFFELYTLNSHMYYNLSSLKGENIRFEKNRALIFFDRNHTTLNNAFICSLQTSYTLLKVLRSRNITAGEYIFGDNNAVERQLRKEIERLCLSVGIPMFALDSIHGFQERYGSKLSGKISVSDDVLWETWFPRRRKRILKTHLEAVDWIFKYITQKKECYHWDYSPHRLLVTLSK